jgi:potassium uptake Trk family protein
MVDNLGFTLTPDSMISFQDAVWPMIFMSFLAYAGNTCYPVLLRLVIWTTHKLVPRGSSLKDPLNFLLQHPRRCYTLLFPSRPTWVLFGILFALNFVDILLIIVLDLNNETVNHLPAGPRLAAAIFQAASSRHTGTSSFNLMTVHPGVQFSLLVMMYISVFPIAIAIRSSNTYEEKSLGIYAADIDLDDSEKPTSYITRHIQNQLSFDLWYIFLGIFCISIAEADRIADNADPAFAIFPVFFEVVSAYGNVGLSLGHPSNSTSLCGHFSVFSKLVLCAMMIRGRHRVLPYQLDRAIMLPGEKEGEMEGRDDGLGEMGVKEPHRMKRYHTQ